MEQPSSISIAEDEGQAEQAEQARRESLRSLAQNLLSKRSEAIEYRSSSGIERQWRSGEMMVEGLDGTGPSEMLDYATGDAYRHYSQDQQSQVRSKVIVNIIRSRCETAEGRFEDIILLTGVNNWGLKTTPVPQLSDQLLDDRPAMQNGVAVSDSTGKQASVADVAADIKLKADKAMKGMETEMEDQLIECDYNGEQRKVIRSAVRTGTGILKGPNVVKAIKNSWIPQRNQETGKTAYIISTAEDNSPSSVWVNNWNVYPSPGTGENVQKTAEYIWEKDEILPRDVRNLIGMAGYDDEQLRLVLLEEPLRIRSATDIRHNSGDVSKIETVRLGRSYEKWEYHGDVNKGDLEVMGVDCSCLDGNALSLSACVIFINDRPVKVALNTLDTGNLPYDFFQWTVNSSDEPWGVGIPNMMKWLQRIITAAWRKMMDNSGASSSRVLVVGKGVQPVDGNYEIGGGDKVFISTGDIDDARKAFSQFQLDSRQNELQKVIELALRFVDLETSMPTIFQGEMQTAPETLGATNIAVDSSNIGVRQRVKLYDDKITRPHLTRYYHYNMMYSRKDEIKGDYNVDPRGASVLLEKDQQAQTLLQVFTLKNDPDISRLTDWDKATRQFYASKKLDITKTEAELAAYDKSKADQPPPQDPAIQAAEIRGKNDMERETAKQQAAMTELQFKAAQAVLDRDHDKAMKMIDRDIKMMEYAKDTNISLDKLKVQLSLGSAGMNMQRELSDKKIGSVPEVTTPPVEPPQRAPDGQSFQQ